MTPEELRAAIDGARDDEALGGVLRAWTEALRAPNDLDHMGLANEVAPLARHPSDRVRRALAERCELLPGRIFDEVHALLAADCDHYVCVAARRAGERRAEQRKTASRFEAADRETTALEDEIASTYRKGALTLARRLSKRALEQTLDRMTHEVTKADDSIERALDAMAAELGKPDPSLSALRARLAPLRERVAFQRSLFKRARDYARQVRGSFAPESVASIVTEARAQLVDRLGARAARLDFVADVPADLEMHADRHALLQALQNLLQNAAEAYDAAALRATVLVAARLVERGTRVELRVVDHGVGMSDEAKADLYVPFSSHKAGGTGVGVLIARKMVEEVHGGTLDIQSARGEGTTAILTLPARQSTVRRRP